jgi:hypothetical protein
LPFPISGAPKPSPERAPFEKPAPYPRTSLAVVILPSHETSPDIGTSEFRENNSLGSYWNIRRTESWVYFEAVIEFNQYPIFQDFLRETSQMLDLYLL